MLLLLQAFGVAAMAAGVSAVNLTVKNSGGNATSPYQYGIMFEDINNSGDGGVYAELIQNRAFQGDGIFPSNLSFWSPVGDTSLSLQNLSKPLSAALPTSMRVGGIGELGFSNAGFWGFPVVSSWTYKGSFWVHGGYNGDIKVDLHSSLQNHSWAQAAVRVASKSDSWTQFNYTLRPTADAPNSNNTLTFTYNSRGNTTLDFNLLSLFPPTYKNRENGLRIDLMEAMASLKPSFFRAPGGNNVEGLQSPYWWNWTETIGPIKDRRGYPGTWSYENTNGLGLLEYALWARDLDMELLLAVWSGFWLDGEALTEEELQPYVQSALDEIEFLRGDVSTTWGAVRASLGYPEPFSVKFVEVGNEDSLNGGGPTYRSYRFNTFYDAIAKAYPDITIIASFYDVDGATPPFNASGDFHEYALPSEMVSQFGYFDNYTSAHPILIGEYAVVQYDQPNQTAVSWAAGAPRAFSPFWSGTVAEAIFLLGAERNSHKLIGAAYAPLFQNLNRWEWIPDLIQYDAFPGHTTLTTSYRMIELFSGTRITETLPLVGAAFDPAYYVAGRNDVTGSYILKAAVYNSTDAVPFRATFEGVAAGAKGVLTFLTAPRNSSNPIGGNVVQTHVEEVRAGGNGTFSFELPEFSIAVLEIAAGSGSGSGAEGYGKDKRRDTETRGWKGSEDWRREWR
ncbi:ABFa alfa-L-arabinofuranosidase-A [Lecanosticta acicola]|uniref:non-reducing end alpha-L-arabinofuranosidase n=1 Tax=Lecanosticta acicola TaxID=111012 RepID=A0AAI8Z2Q1_9PEZI|nr:ABFa alfa-L-arabinofuranosidase-A [Lecanosticta acicola]